MENHTFCCFIFHFFFSFVFFIFIFTLLSTHLWITWHNLGIRYEYNYPISIESTNWWVMAVDVDPLFQTLAVPEILFFIYMDY